MSFQHFFLHSHHGGHLGYQNGMILAILNLRVAPMPATKFELNPTGFISKCGFEDFQDGRLGGQLGYRNRTIFCNSESLCHSQCLQSSFSSIWFIVWQMSLKEFQDDCHDGHLGYWNQMEHFNHFWILCHSDASHKVSAQSDKVWEEISFKEFQDGHQGGGHFGHWKGMILAILNHHVATMPSAKFELNQA